MKKSKVQIEDIFVKTVGSKKLIEFLNIQLNEKEELLIDEFAIIHNAFEVNPDCCFSILHNEHFENKIQPVIKIDCRIKRQLPNGSWSFSIFPEFVKTILLEDYNKLATEVKLINFIRYNYNPRIMSNQELLLKKIRENYALLIGKNQD